jgi:Type II CAAX prenyl endopeptidase Rce1-like
MNILIMFGVVAAAGCLLWAVQSVALKISSEPLAWPLRYTTRKPLVRWTGRVMIHSSWLIIMIGTPLALGMRPLDALRQAFPLPVPWRDMAVAYAIMFCTAVFLYLLYYAAGWLRIEPQFDQKTRCAKLIRRMPGPWTTATLEEGVFRGTLLEQLLQAFPVSPGFTVLAIVLSAALFSSIHFIKVPGYDKPVWQPTWGLFFVGCLFGLAYVVGGRSLWLPIVMHAAAIFVTELMKLYVLFQGPHWLVGYPEFPQSGLIGSLLVLFMAIMLVVLI